MPTETLKEYLVHWQDIGDAAAGIAICLGLMAPEEPEDVAKHVFFGGGTEIGRMLYQFVFKLVEAGVLETREGDESEVRWNQSFKGSWED